MKIIKDQFYEHLYTPTSKDKMNLPVRAKTIKIVAIVAQMRHVTAFIIER